MTVRELKLLLQDIPEDIDVFLLVEEELESRLEFLTNIATQNIEFIDEENGLPSTTETVLLLKSEQLHMSW